MPLAPGARLGPYEIVAPLGVGGMGEVYRMSPSTEVVATQSTDWGRSSQEGLTGALVRE